MRVPVVRLGALAVAVFGIAIVANSTAVTAPARASNPSLPSVASGARPGPDVLYEASPAAPQLENRNPRFNAPPLLVSGQEAYVDGEYIYQDYLYDDYGSDTNGSGATPLSPRRGDIEYPTNAVRYGGNAADIVEFRIDVSTESVLYRVSVNTLLEADSTIIAIVADTDANAATGVSTLPRDPGAPFPGTEEVIFAWGTGAEHVDLVPSPVVTPLTINTDLEANQMTIEVPRAVSDAGGVWRMTVAAGLYNTANGGWLLPVTTATATTPGGAGPLDTAPTGIFNLAFRFDEPFVATDTPADTNQSLAVRNKTPTQYAHNIDFGALDAGTDSTTVPSTGLQIRMFPSRLQLGEGRNLNTFPAYRGQLQPYSLWVPSGYSPATPAGFVLALHSLSEHYWQYNGTLIHQQFGDQRGALVATSLSRGDDGWYQNEAEYDVFEMWNDVAFRFTLDPEKVVITGYSMGGYATYRLGTLYPDLFGKAFSVVGPPGDGIWVPPAAPTGGAETLTNNWLENARNLPYMNLVATQDELVPYAGTRAQNLGAPEHGIMGFDQHGLRFHFLTFETADHLALAALDYNFPMAGPFLGDAVINRDPYHVTFSYAPAADDGSLGLVHDHAYWVSGLSLADASKMPFPAEGTIDVLSHAFGLGDPASSTGVQQGTEPLPYTEYFRIWATPPAISVQDRLDVRLTNLSEVTIDVPRAGIGPCDPLVLSIDTDSSSSLLLSGFSMPVVGAEFQIAAQGTELLLPPGHSNVTAVPDCDGDGVLDIDEANCGGDTNNASVRPERVDGPFAGFSDDGDAQIDEPLPAGSSGFDCDGDGYKGSTEDHVFSDSGGRDQDACGADGWPAELASGGQSANAITLTDLSSFIAPFRRLGTSPGDPDFDVRYDLVPGAPSSLKHINLTDMANLVLTRPPMLGGVREFGGPVCPWPP